MGRGGLWGAGGRLFEAGRLLTFSASKKGANSRLGAYSNKYGISSDCSGLHENPEQSGFFGTLTVRKLGCDSQD